MIDIIKLYQKFGITFQESGPGIAKGWVGIPCPFCTGHHGFHLGYCVDPKSKFFGAFSCWRCGGKKATKVISTILSVDEREAYLIIKQYSLDGSNIAFYSPGIKKGPSSGVTICKLPPGTGSLKAIHKKYLRDRGFLPSKIAAKYSLQATGPAGGYNHRIIIPIEFESKLVSYQGRDITDRSELKYKACREEDEVRPHKHCLYGYDNVVGDSVVVVEGVTDVWRLGDGSVATFGIKYTQEQVALLLRFKRVFILFDGEEQAQEQARLLAIALYSEDRHVEIVELSGGDPGEMKQEDADGLMRELLN
jgi:hypothetical protein